MGISASARFIGLVVVPWKAVLRIFSRSNFYDQRCLRLEGGMWQHLLHTFLSCSLMLELGYGLSHETRLPEGLMILPLGYLL